MKNFICRWCGGTFEDWSCRKNWRKTCSRSCQIKLANTGRKNSGVWRKLKMYVKEYRLGKTFAEISKKYKISKHSLQIVFKKAGIKTRKFGARKGTVGWLKGKENKLWKGKNNPNWKGGITPLVRRIRACTKYIAWVRKCRKSGNQICVKCGFRGKKKGDIHVDHYPIMFHKILEKYKITSYKKALQCKKLWDVKNGRCLCKKCHELITAKQRKNSFKVLE